MEKKTKKKGFSMVEMLVVIVIIAVLVAVFMPMAVTETVKSHAAANAANLRAIEGKLTTMRLQYPDEFATILSNATGRYEAIKDGYVFIVDILYGQGTGDAILEDRYAKFTAENKVMTLYNPGVVIYDVPQAKAMNLKGSNLSNSVVVSEGTEMTVFITENKVAASYGLYTKDVFADIAEDGSFDGKIQGPQQGGGGLTGAWCDLWNKHNWGPDGICKTCGFDKRWHDCVDVKEENMWGQLVAGSDGKCDECGETMPHSCTDGNGDGKCDVCEVTMHICEDTDNNHYCNFRGSWLGQIFSGDTCNKRLSECNEDEIRKTGHHCSICGALVSQHAYAEGVCTLCGRSSHVAPEDCTDNGKDGDHICDTPNCGTQVSTNHPDKDPTDHKCDDCSIELTDKHVDKKGTPTGRYSETGDHYCDVSGCHKKLDECSSSNNDGKCDKCGGVVAHKCTDGADKNHTCDIDGCNEKLSECVDTNKKDHKCDECGNTMAANPSCSDRDGDGDHNCDYCGTDKASQCSDPDKDHKCNECQGNVGTHSQNKKLTNSTHGCGYCTYSVSCTDNNTDHNCDSSCGNTLGTHKYYNYNDATYHKCDYCGTEKHNYGFMSNKCSVCDYEKSGGGCVTPDTLVTMADGSLKRIDEVTYSDYLLVWDFFKGEYAVVPAAIIFDHGYDNNTVIALNFSDGTTVKVVNLHQFYDADLNKFVTIDAASVAQYVGHSFAKQGGKTVELVGYTVSQEYVEAFGIISAVHYNIFVEGMFSTDFMAEDYDLFNYFAFGDDMKFDQAQMKSDIEQYGLYTYEEFADYLTYEQFIGFNVPYMKVAVGKGNYTHEGILNLISEYLGQ